MKIILASLVFALALSAAEGPPPQPAGDKARFTVVSGTVDHGGGPVPTFMRVDTFTGQTWILGQVPIPKNGKALLPVWIENHETSSELYQKIIAAMQAGQ